MNLLTTPWHDFPARLFATIGQKKLRAPLICFASSLLLVGVGKVMLASRVSEALAFERGLAGERATLDREVADAHVRETRLRRDLQLARRLADVGHGSRRLVRLVAMVVNHTPNSIWFSRIAIDRTHLSIEAKALSIQAIATMLRSTSMAHRGGAPRVKLISRTSEQDDPILAFVLEIQRRRTTPPVANDVRS